MEEESLTGQPHHPYPWRLFFLLLGGSVLGVLALLPYLTVVIEPMLVAHPMRLPLPVVALIQSVVNFSVVVGLGLFLARKVGLGAPILESWLYRRDTQVPTHLVPIAIATGSIAGLITLGLIRSPLGIVLAALPVASEGTMPLWKRLLACFYGGLDEEIVTRLFLLSLFIWLFSLICRRRSRPSAVTRFWIANCIVAVLFGAGHLPLAARISPLTPQLVGVVITLNALCALPFGYLYWRRGLEAAMIAHFSADLVLHVIGPAIT